uniref:Uncharacterized protein n=1 Tax=Anopheles atroparvus TaxID=41427 RepID=A0AAG5D057_ANOAO
MGIFQLMLDIFAPNAEATPPRKYRISPELRGSLCRSLIPDTGTVETNTDNTITLNNGRSASLFHKGGLASAVREECKVFVCKNKIRAYPLQKKRYSFGCDGHLTRKKRRDAISS